VSAMLSIEGLSLRFAGLSALSNVDLAVEAGEVVAIVGPNGAGKTSLLNCITGLYRPTSGRIALDGRVLSGLGAHRIVAAGIARTFQHIELVPHLSVRDNVLVARHHLMRANPLWSLIWYGPAAAEEHEQNRAVLEILDAVGMADSIDLPAGTLNLAGQKLVTIARALATSPRVLLLDEPASGLAPEEKDSLQRLLPQLRERYGLTIILVEHDLALATELCTRFVVMNFGEKLADGEPREVLSRPEVIEAYIGITAPAAAPMEAP
jgi:branched-chain amino acid transport system ATP-binding protein